MDWTLPLNIFELFFHISNPHQDHGSVEDVVGFKKKKTIAAKVILETKTKFF